MDGLCSPTQQAIPFLVSPIHLGDGGSDVSGTSVGSAPDRRRHENPSQLSSVPGATCGCVPRPLGLICNHWASLHRRL